MFDLEPFSEIWSHIILWALVEEASESCGTVQFHYCKNSLLKRVHGPSFPPPMYMANPQWH